jgi:hypothetical protein
MSWCTYQSSRGVQFPLPTFTHFVRVSQSALNKDGMGSTSTNDLISQVLPGLEAGTIKDPRELMDVINLVPSDDYLREAIDTWICYEGWLQDITRKIEASPDYQPSQVYNERWPS